MKTKLLVATCVAITSLGSFAYAGDSAKVTGMAGGAVTGAIVGGPVGAVIGGAVGLTAGAALDTPPREVVTYVQEQPMPNESVIIQQPVVVGKTLPGTVIVQPIPGRDRYAYAVVNHHRVIVDARSNTVLEVVE